MQPTRRLFFALSIPETLQQTLVSWRAQQFSSDAGHPVAAANLHLTLAFLGDVSAQKERALCTQAARIRQAPFTLHLNDAGHWPRPGVVARLPPGTARIVTVGGVVTRSGRTQRLLSKPAAFSPTYYVTAQRHAPGGIAPATFDWTLTAEHFSLYESRFEQGKTRYQQLADWTLS